MTKRVVHLVSLALFVLAVLGGSGSAPGSGRAWPAAAALAAGCAPHTSFASACTLGPGPLSDVLATGAGTNYYQIVLPGAGQALQVDLTGAAFQAALLRDGSGVTGSAVAALTAARPQYATGEYGPTIPNGSTAGGTPPQTIQPFAAPFQDTPFQDTPFQAAPFQDTPFQDTPFQDTGAQASGYLPMQILAVTAGTDTTRTLTHFTDVLDAPEIRQAAVVLAIWSPTSSTAPYAVNVRFLAPADTCTTGAASLPELPAGFTLSGSASPTAPAGVNTVILTSEERWARYYGSDASRSVLQELQKLAAAPEVNGVVLSVDADPGVAAAYAAWDENLCSATLANVVAARVKQVLMAYVVANPSVHYVVMAGADPIVPFFRVPDGAAIGDEAGYAGQTGLDANSAEAAAFSRDNLLTDDYYADPHGELSGSRVLYSPQLALGRLVERPADITAVIETFLSQHGTLQAVSGLVTGYDFLRSTADTVGDLLDATLSPVARLDGDTWSATQVNQALAGAGSAPPGPDITFFSGHFVHQALQTAIRDTYDAANLAEKTALAGKLLFSLGCHSGASIADTFADPGTGVSTLDWAQAVAGLGGVLIGNTGYGYGDSDVPAYGQELMTDLAAQLTAGSSGGPIAIGDALLAAKARYRARNDGKWDGYHTKTLMEAALYGLPMYTIGMPVELGQSAGFPTLPVTAAAAKLTEFRTGAQSPPANTVVYHVEIDVPTLNQVQAPTGRGAYFQTNEGVDVRAMFPVQPQLTYQVPAVPGYVFHGAALTGATYREIGGFAPVIARPMWDQAEYQPQFTYADFTPAEPLTSNAVIAASGSLQQFLVITLGQFRSTGQAPAGNPQDPSNAYVAAGVAYPHTVGTERLFTHLSLDLYYGGNADWRGAAPRITAISCAGPAAANINVDAGSQRNLQRVAVLSGSGGTLTLTALSNGALGWTATLNALTSGDTYALEAVDNAGNTAITPLLLPDSATHGCGAPLQPSQPAGRQPGAVSIAGAGNPAVAPGGITVYGSWNSGNAPCNLPGSSWLLGFFVTAVTAPGAAVAAPVQVIPAPCGADGAPLPWTTVLSTAPGAQVCVGVFFGTVANLQSADGVDCTGGTALPLAPLPTPTAVPPRCRITIRC